MSEINGWHGIKRTLIIVGCVMLVLINAFALIYTTVDRTWDPLCNYPVQDVINKNATDVYHKNPKDKELYPHIKPGDTVNVVAMKCNNTDKPITVRGVRSWQTVPPTVLGTVIEDSHATGIREPGRRTLTYQNPIPSSVIVRSRTILQTTGKPAVWILTGNETPVEPDGTEGRTKTWETEPFVIETQ